MKLFHVGCSDCTRLSQWRVWHTGLVAIALVTFSLPCSVTHHQRGVKQGSNTFLGGLPSHPSATEIQLTPESRLENWSTEWTFQMAKGAGAEVVL